MDQNDYTPPTSVAELFGEDLGPDPFKDAAGIPKSAQQHAQRRPRSWKRKSAGTSPSSTASPGTRPTARPWTGPWP